VPRPPAAPPPVVVPTPPARRNSPARRVAWVWAGMFVATAAAAGVDYLVGGLDGRPATFLLALFALSFWDGLAARVWARIAEIAAVVVGVAAGWLAIAAVRPEGWWRGEIAFGLACAIVGTVHALASRRRTVER
jgi:hypothetical protein